MSAPGRLITEDEFANIIIRETETGGQIRIKDVGRVELGSQDYNSFGRLDGQPAGAMAVYLLPGANQLAAAEGIYETLRTAKTFFPSDMDYRIVYDTTPAVEASIESIFHTFLEAVVLVTLVVFIFLQNLRATIIPLLTVPVSLIGTFIFFPMLGFSVNTLSMFGLVLAIGIVVDDAIVVVEAVMHHIEHGMAPKEATIQAMKEVSAPVIGIALILSAVFIPVAFIPGLTGQMYQQFALTIAISVLLSAFSALSLSPALAAMLLKPAKPSSGILGKFFGGFNKVFERATNGYVKGAQMLVRRSILTIGIVVLVAVGAGLFGGALPAGFIPEEDQGIFGVNVTLPPAASLERTSAVLAQVEEILGKTEGVESYQTIGGYGVVTSTYQPNFGTIFIRLKPWHDRHGAENARARLHGADPGPGRPHPRRGHLSLQHPDDLGVRRLRRLQLPDPGPQRQHERRAARRALPAVHGGRAQAPGDREHLHVLRPALPPGQGGARPGEGAQARRARERGLPGARPRASAAATSTTSTASGDCSASTSSRRPTTGASPRTSARSGCAARPRTTWSRSGRSITITAQGGTELTNRFNLLRSVEFNGVPGRGYASGQALAALEESFKETMPPEMGFTYSSLSYQEKIAPPAAPTLVAAIVFVFLLLAAMYESWRLPWAVLLGSPLVALGAFFGVWLAGYDNNVYVQIGNIMLIGLAAKNAILIVEFAKAKHDKEGMGIEEAALESARLRFRPILMTAFAFILGVVPLMRASGAGAGAQNVMGTAVFLGMLVATALGVFLIPGNYAFVELLGRKKHAGRSGDAATLPAPSPGGAH